MSNPGTVHCPACGQATPAIAFCGHCGGPLPRVVEDTAKTQFGLPAFDAAGALDDAKTLASMPAQAAVPAVTAASVAPAGPIASRPIGTAASCSHSIKRRASALALVCSQNRRCCHVNDLAELYAPQQIESLRRERPFAAPLRTF